jgi:hypothetical protein
MKQLLKDLVESPQTAKPRRQRHLCHRQVRIVDKLFRKQHSPRLRYCNRRSPQVLQKQPSQLSLSNSQALCQSIDAASLTVQCSFAYQRQRSRNCVRRPAPRRHLRRYLRPATQAGTIPGLLRRRSRAKECAVLVLRRTRRTYGPAVDPRRLHADINQTIKASVLTLKCSVAGSFVRQFHVQSLSRLHIPDSRFSDINISPMLARRLAACAYLKTAFKSPGNLASRSSLRKVFISSFPSFRVATTPDSRNTLKWCDSEDFGLSTSNTPQGCSPFFAN